VDILVQELAVCCRISMLVKHGVMKKASIFWASPLTFLLLAVLMAIAAGAQSSKDGKLMGDAAAAEEAFLTAEVLMKNLFDKAHGYVIFPNVGKGGIGIGGAAGNGIVYEGGKPIGKARLRQVNIGFQFGGQAYREVIFFKPGDA
jgi:lipid-binding SYLF domain-containing protein